MRRNTKLWLEEQATGSELAGEPSGWVRRERPEYFSIEPLSGTEYMQAQQMQSNVSHRLRCVFLAGCHSAMRLTEGEDVNNPTRIFNVESVVNVGERNRELEWMAKEAT